MERHRLPGSTALLAACVVLAACSSHQDPQGWAEAPVVLPSPAAAGSRYPSLATTPDGTVLLSWTAPAADGAFALQYSSFDGHRWGPATVAATGRDWFVNWADFGSVTPIDGSLWAAHWLAQRPGSAYAYDLRMAVSRDRGTTWSPPLSPHHDGTATEHGFASLALWQGEVMVAWLDGRASGGEEGHDSGHGAMSLRTATVDAAGRTPAGDLEVDSRVCDCCQTDVARTTDGLVLVYRDRDENEVRDIAVVRVNEAGWSAPAIVHHDGWKISACPVNGPAIAAHGRNVAVAWFTAPDQPRVRLAFSTDGGRNFAPALDVADGGVAGRVDVVLLGEDRAVVSWLGDAPDGPAIFAQPWSRSGALGAPITVARSSVERSSGFPRMAVSGDNLLFAWTEADPAPSVRTASVGLR